MTAIYTDGACKGNPGPGGWAVWSRDIRGANRSGDNLHTTNNRMELKAVLEALTAVRLGTNVTIYTDSEYVVSVAKESAKVTANQDIVGRIRQYLYVLNQRGTVSLRWVSRGSVDGNRQADKVASLRAQQAKERLHEQGLVRIRDDVC